MAPLRGEAAASPTAPLAPSRWQHAENLQHVCFDSKPEELLFGLKF